MFDLVNFVPIDFASTVGAALPTAVQQVSTHNVLAMNSLTTISIKAPAECLTDDGNGVVLN